MENHEVEETLQEQGTDLIERKNSENAENEKQKKGKSGNGAVVGLLAAVLLLLAVLIVMLIVDLIRDNKSNQRMDELALAITAVQTKTDDYQATLSEMNEQLVKISDFNARLSAMMGEEECGASSENDVLIGGEYMIVSTEAISDAYKSGDTSGLDAEQKKTMELAADVIDEVIEDGMTDYEKEVAIYDWMYENIRHDDGITVAIPTTGSYADNPKGVLSVKKAVCVGYATTFRLFMQMLDIECMVVHDTYLSHSWDIVNIEGNWYHTDLYMDAGSTRYANFNMTDEMCSTGHDWDKNFFPNATSVEYCYAVKNAEAFVSLEEAAKSMRDMIEQTESSGISYKITGDNMYIVYQQLNLMLQEVDQYVMSSEIGENAYLSWSGFMSDEETIILSIQFEYFSYDDDVIGDEEELSEEDLQEAYDAVSEAFFDFYDEHEESYYEKNDWEDGFFEDIVETGEASEWGI